jgi:hypothetical protein
MQLHDANKTNEKLQEKILELQSGNQKRVNDLQEKVAELQEKLTKLKIKNQALKSCIEFMQMQPGRYSAHQGFHSQPPPFQNALSFSASLTSAHVPQGPSHGDFDPSLKNDFFPIDTHCKIAIQGLLPLLLSHSSSLSIISNFFYPFHLFFLLLYCFVFALLSFFSSCLFFALQYCPFSQVTCLHFFKPFQFFLVLL